MKKLLILFLFVGMFLCFGEDSSHGDAPAAIPTQAPAVTAPAPATAEAVPAPAPSIVVQCPYCHAAYTVYGTGIYRCSTCGNNFEVVLGAVSAAPPMIITPPPFVYTPPPVYYPCYPYYPGWYGPGFNLFFGFGHRHFERGHEHFEHGRGHHR